MANVRRFLLGRRLASEESHEARISNPVALAVFSSDALSSVAYATARGARRPRVSRDACSREFAFGTLSTTGSRSACSRIT